MNPTKEAYVEREGGGRDERTASSCAMIIQGNLKPKLEPAWPGREMGLGIFGYTDDVPRLTWRQCLIGRGEL